MPLFFHILNYFYAEHKVFFHYFLDLCNFYPLFLHFKMITVDFM